MFELYLSPPTSRMTAFLSLASCKVYICSNIQEIFLPGCICIFCVFLNWIVLFMETWASRSSDRRRPLISKGTLVKDKIEMCIHYLTIPIVHPLSSYENEQREKFLVNLVHVWLFSGQLLFLSFLPNYNYYYYIMIL